METENLKVLTLDSIPTLKELIGSGGGLDVNLLTAYAASPTANDAYDANYINTKLDSRNLVLAGAKQPTSPGSNTYIIRIGTNAGGSFGAGTYNQAAVAIGREATAEAIGYSGSPLASSVAIGAYAKAETGGVVLGGNATVYTFATNGIAIGNNAKITGYGASQSANYNTVVGSAATITAGSGGGVNYSVALGSYSTTKRSGCVSIGDGSNNLNYGTRYLTNVKAGTQDTDATNVAQVNSVTTGDVLYASSEAETAITLTASVSQYEKLEIIGSWTMPYTGATTPLQIITFWHTNDQDNSHTFQLQATDLDSVNNQKVEVVETWSITSPTTIEMVGGAKVSGSLTDQVIEELETPELIITKVIGIKTL